MVLASPGTLRTPPPSSSPPKTPIRSYSAQTPPRNGNSTPPPPGGRRRGRGTEGQNGPQSDADALRHPRNSATAQRPSADDTTANQTTTSHRGASGGARPPPPGPPPRPPKLTAQRSSFKVISQRQPSCKQDCRCYLQVSSLDAVCAFFAALPWPQLQRIIRLRICELHYGQIPDVLAAASNRQLSTRRARYAKPVA